MLYMPFIFFFQVLFFFSYWRVIPLQCCCGLCHTSMRISHNYITYIPCLLNLPSYSTLISRHRAPGWVPCFNTSTHALHFFFFLNGKTKTWRQSIPWLSSLTNSWQTWDSNPRHLTLVQCSFHGQRGSGVAPNLRVPFFHVGCPLQFKLIFIEYILGIKQQTWGHVHTHFIQSLQPEEFFGNQTVQTRKEGCHQGYKMKGKSSQSVNWPQYISFSWLQVLQLVNEYVLNYL